MARDPRDTWARRHAARARLRGRIGGPDARWQRRRRRPRRRDHHRPLGEAIRRARARFPPSPSQRRETADAADLFGVAVPAELRVPLWRIYHPALLARERFVQADLASTLEEIARGGAEAFYRGTLAKRIALGAAAAGSPLTADDLARHH